MLQTTPQCKQCSIICCMAAGRRAAADLLCQQLDVAACCEGYKLKAVLVLPDDVQRLCPNGACSVPLSCEHYLACIGPVNRVWLEGSIGAKTPCQDKFASVGASFCI